MGKSMANKPDTQVQSTKCALKSALLWILKTKPIAEVTIKELCEAAGLNRGPSLSNPTQSVPMVNLTYKEENA